MTAIATIPNLGRRALLAALTATVAERARAQGTYPVRPIRLIVAAPPGGGGDTVGRLVAGGLSTRLGQPVVVENRAGAAGNIGAEALVRAAPDGYTLLLPFTGHVINPSLFRRLPFDPVRDFAPVALVASNQTVLVVRTNSPYRSLQDLIAAAKAAPGRLNGGFLPASTQHLATEMLFHQAGIEAVGVPYRGNAQAMNDLLGGSLDFMFYTMTAVPQIEAGQLRALVVTEPRRSRLLPDVPTTAEAGLPDLVAPGWYGLLAPAGTPAPVIARLSEAVRTVLAEEEVRTRLAAIGCEPLASTPEEFVEFIRREIPRWASVVRAARIEPQ
ncbi:Bug family tripartite tricarboxylate transporter substrate binding protein [Falsiroseomonas sp.]|uniref:Bug family tripartite tricarboxylate transporter substrate binding protein n=1 Tax=Falsiroseomonas sp. TaxID=2870721 RepID=UPI003F706992